MACNAHVGSTAAGNIARAVHVLKLTLENGTDDSVGIGVIHHGRMVGLIALDGIGISVDWFDAWSGGGGIWSKAQ